MRSSRSELDPGRGRSGVALLLVTAMAVCPGCARIEKVGGVEGAIRLVMEDLRALGRVFIGEPSPRAKPSAAEAARQANAELLNELFQVVLLRAPLNEAEFGVFLGTLNQGATLEGVYNGFTHSSIYRSHEMRYGPASEAALQAFAREMAELQQDLPAPSRLDPSMAKPLAEIDTLSESDAHAANVQAAISAALPSEVMRVFEGASLFTLKRVLGDETLKVLNQQQTRGGLARWYGSFAARQAGKGVDFGLALRNKADEAFHSEWAEGVIKTSQQDRLTWEVLNRVHRILNQAEWVSRRAEKNGAPK